MVSRRLRSRPGRAVARLVAGLATIGALAPASAEAHGLVGRTDLPIPAWLFTWGAAIVLIVSFVALGVLWPQAKLERSLERRLLRLPGALSPVCGAFGVAVFAVVIYSGLDGSQVTNANLAPTFVYVLFWVGVPILSAVLGDVFSVFNPWLAVARAVRWVLRRLVPGGRRQPLLAYPERVGRWPAVVTILAFGWLELVYVDRDQPSRLAVIALVYALLQLVGMALYGVDRWSSRADGFGVEFNLFSRLSALTVHDGVLLLRRPLSGLVTLEMWPGTVALLCIMIGITTFDGASNGAVWSQAAPPLQRMFHALGAGQIGALELASTTGLLFAILLVAGFYRAGVAGMRSVSDEHHSDELWRRFAHTLLPIAFGYLVAHYFSLFIFQGQAAAYLASDPLGHGANLFGTANAQVDYQWISTTGIWYVQVGALVAGHIAGLILAHDRALIVYHRAHDAVRSQYWMLVVMVGFTSLGLWLLSAVSAR